MLRVAGEQDFGAVAFRWGGWNAKSLYNFAGGTDGKSPVGSVVFDGSGNIYGAAQVGGQYGAGVVFEITR